MTHTPGPWSVDHREYLNIVGPMTERGCWLIAQTMSTNATDRANARLIAAAPDMLEVLRMVLNHSEGYVRHAIETTIAKAEGHTQRQSSAEPASETDRRAATTRNETPSGGSGETAA